MEQSQNQWNIVQYILQVSVKLAQAWTACQHVNASTHHLTPQHKCFHIFHHVLCLVGKIITAVLSVTVHRTNLLLVTPGTRIFFRVLPPVFLDIEKTVNATYTL